MSAKVICVLAGIIGLAAKRMVQQDAQLDTVQDVHEIDRRWYQNQTEKANIKIPAAVTRICGEAFEYEEDLKTIDLTKVTNLTSIGYAAFHDSGLESIIIPSSVTEIGDTAFWDAQNLKKVDLSQASHLTRISEECFMDTGLASIVIPSSVKSIGKSAFENTALESIVIPSSVTSIGEMAFYNATNLQTIDLTQATQLNCIAKKAFCNTKIDRSQLNLKTSELWTPKEMREWLKKMVNLLKSEKKLEDILKQWDDEKAHFDNCNEEDLHDDIQKMLTKAASSTEEEKEEMLDLLDDWKKEEEEEEDDEEC